jgi:hypothetical protein
MVSILWGLCWAFLWAVGVFLLLLLYILFVPCRYLVEGEYEGEFRGLIMFTVWPFTVRREITGKEAEEHTGPKKQDEKKQGTQKQDNKKQKQAKVKSERKGSRLRQLRQVWSCCRDRAVVGALCNLAGKLWRKLRPRTLRLHGQFGFEDPYYTGMAAAFIAMLHLPEVEMYPDFSQSGFCGNIYIEGRSLLVVLVYYFLKALFTKPLRPVLWQFLKKERGGISVGF